MTESGVVDPGESEAMASGAPRREEWVGAVLTDRLGHSHPIVGNAQQHLLIRLLGAYYDSPTCWERLDGVGQQFA